MKYIFPDFSQFFYIFYELFFIRVKLKFMKKLLKNRQNLCKLNPINRDISLNFRHFSNNFLKIFFIGISLKLNSLN